MSRLTRSCALAATALVPSLLLASPAQAASYTISFSSVTGFSSPLGSAQTLETVTVQNLSGQAVTLVYASIKPTVETRIIPAGGSYTYVMPADTATIVAEAAVAVPVHVIS